MIGESCLKLIRLKIIRRSVFEIQERERELEIISDFEGARMRCGVVYKFIVIKCRVTAANAANNRHPTLSRI